MKKILTFTALAAMLFAACSKEESKGPRTRCVTVDPTVVEMSKTEEPAAARTRATEVDFEAGDAMGLTITTESGSIYAGNAKFLFADGKFFSADNLLWYDDINQKSNLVAYYPYADAVPTEFSVRADQSGTGYTLSDLMLASKDDVLPSVAATNMTFYHQLTKLVVKITNESGGTISDVVIKNAVPTATVDLASKTVKVKAGAGTADVKAKVREAGKFYQAIIVPQTVALRLAVTITSNGVSKTLTQRHKELDLLRGQYSISIRVLPSDIDVTVTGDIEEWGDNGEIPVDDEVEFIESENSFVYDGETYGTVTMKDGRKWMAENLRYIPKGKKVSADPADKTAEIWYPYSSNGTTCTPLTDAASIAKLGYLYAVETALKAEITADNSGNFEGVQGICPKGWHIPTQADWIGLVGKTTKNAEGVDLTDTSAPYYDAVYDGAKIPALDADGFQFTRSGTCMRGTIAGSGAYQKAIYPNPGGELSLSCVVGSTLHKNNYSTTDPSQLTNIQFFGAMTLYNLKTAPEGKLSVSYLAFKSGCGVRCIKDKSAN